MLERGSHSSAIAGVRPEELCCPPEPLFHARVGLARIFCVKPAAIHKDLLDIRAAPNHPLGWRFHPQF